MFFCAKINLAVANPSAPPGEPGEAPIELYEEPWFPGTLIKHLKYDGLGRLAEVQSPYPDPPANLGKLRTERFYYDGLRRIQERVIDPVIDSDGAGDSNDPGLMAAAQGEPGAVDGDGNTASLQLENYQDTSNMTYTRIEREYIWGPGDRGIDELLVQYDWSRNPWWMLTDDGGDLVAMVANTGPSGTAAVAAQWTYDAYGAVIAQTIFDVSAPVNRCGHKGLFADRLDVGIVNGSGGPDRLRLEPGAKLVYQVRNRAYSPELGRWLQSDPNATGLVLVGDARALGHSFTACIASFDQAGLYSDGSHLYQYVNAAPWNSRDPLGLYSGEEAFVDFSEAMGVLSPLPGPSDIIGAMLQSLVDEYSANLSWDASWATDLAANDDLHSRLDAGWVPAAMARGAYNAFTIELPFSNGSVNPWDLAVADSRFGQRFIRVGGKAASFSSRARVKVPSGNYYVNFFKTPKYKHRFVVFPDSAIKRTKRIAPQGNSEADIAEANRLCGKPAHYDWSEEFNGVLHTWHHDNRKGVMQLVPRDLHEATRAHVGGAKI